MAHAPLLGYASIPQESNRAHTVTAKSFHFALDSLSVQAVEIQALPATQAVKMQALPAQAVETQAGLAQVVETQAVEETASLMRTGLENLGAGDIRGVFVLPTKENAHQTAGEIVRVAFLDTAGGCFMYDSITSKMALCDREEEVLVRDQEELVASSLSYLPADSLFIPRESVQVASLCSFLDTIELSEIGTVSISLILVGVVASAIMVPVMSTGIAVGTVLTTTGIALVLMAGGAVKKESCTMDRFLENISYSS